MAVIPEKEVEDQDEEILSPSFSIVSQSNHNQGGGRR